MSVIFPAPAGSRHGAEVDYFVKAGDMVACRSPQITVEDDKVCSAINTMRLAN